MKLVLFSVFFLDFQSLEVYKNQHEPSTLCIKSFIGAELRSD